MSYDFSQFGGRLVTPAPVDTMGLAGAPTEPCWDFGRIRDPHAIQTVQGLIAAAGQPTSLYDVAPHLRNYGVGKTVVLHDVAKKVMGGIQSQYQPRGTCVSRGAKRIVDLCQCIAIFCGAPLKFDYASHAYIYGACREYGNFLSDQDGAVGAWAAWAVNHDGSLRNLDCQDDDNKDDLAVKWGRTGVPKEWKEKGRLHLVVKVIPINSFDEARDFICAGLGGITIASNVGYQMTRDKDGVCRRQGNWAHQMSFTGYRHDLDALLQDQSWGPNVPGGPCILGQPNYSFWTLRQDASSQIAERDCFGFYWNLQGWEGGEATWRP